MNAERVRELFVKGWDEIPYVGGGLEHMHCPARVGLPSTMLIKVPVRADPAVWHGAGKVQLSQSKMVIHHYDLCNASKGKPYYCLRQKEDNE